MKEKKSAGKVIKVIIIIFLIVILGLFLLVMCTPDGDEEGGSSEETEEDYQNAENKGKDASGGKAGTATGSRQYGDPDTSWTVMLYLCGTNLESKGGYASFNLGEICDAKLDDNVNFLIEAGGTREWQTDGISNGELTRLHVEHGEMMIDEECQSSSMGDAETLSDFISWGASEYPADRYMLIFWNHGGGSLFGVCQDELYDEDALSLKEVGNAIVNAEVPLEVAGFDACLMSTLETAETLQGYAHYMVASEETEPGTGWNYTEWLNYLSENPGCDGKELGSRIVDSYMDKCTDYGEDSMATLAVTDLTRLPELSAAFRDYSGELVMSTQNAGDFQAVIREAARSESYGERSGEDGTYDMVDLGDLVKNTGGILTENSDEVLKALDNAVVYESHGAYRSRASGLSVFYPKYIDSDIYQAYEEITDNTAYLEYASIVNGEWDEGAWETAWQEAYDNHNSGEQSSGGFFDSFFGSGSSGEGNEVDEEEEPEEEPEEGGTSGGFVESFFGNDNNENSVNLFQNISPVRPGDEELKYEQYLDEESILNLNISSGIDLVKEVRFRIMFEQDEENLLYMGCDSDINADYEKGKFSDNFRGTWITIGGEFVCAELIDTTDDYYLYIIPAIVNGEETYIRAVYEFDKEAYKVLGTYDGADEDSGLSGRNIHPLKNGDKIEFIFYSTNLNADDDAEPEEEVSGSIVWSDDTEMLDEEMADGKFYYMFEIVDVFGNETECDPIIMEIEDGKMYAYEIE